MTQKYDNPHDVEDIRFASFISELTVDYLAVDRGADETLYRKHYGDGGSATFWRIYLFGTRNILDFTHRMSALRSEKWADIDVWRISYRKAMVEAFRSEQPFLKGPLQQAIGAKHWRDIKDPAEIFLTVREAVEWLAENPWTKHLLPVSLNNHLMGILPQPDRSSPIQARRQRGRPADTRAGVVASMLEHLRSGKTSVQSLANEKQAALEVTYKAAKDTCLAARKIALKTYEAELNSAN